MHPVIQSAVAAQHVKDMLDRAAEDSRVREARRSRPGRRWRRHAAVAATSVAATNGAVHRGAAATQCCPD